MRPTSLPLTFPLCSLQDSFPNALVDAPKVVIQKIERDCMAVILCLFAESVCQPGEAPHTHTHTEKMAHYRNLDLGLPLRARLHGTKMVGKRNSRTTLALSLGPIVSPITW